LLQLRPDLSWRDVQHVLAAGATLVDAGHASWSPANARGYRHSEHYGFGNVVLPRLVARAKSHVLVGPAAVLCDTGSVSVQQAFPTRVVFDCPNPTGSDAFIEHVELVASWRHDCRGQVTFSLGSGHANSSLAEYRRDCARGNATWTFRSVRHWGEHLPERWTLEAGDAVPRDAHTGVLGHVQLVVYGY
jgi:kexin